MKKKTRDRIKYCVRGFATAAVAVAVIALAMLMSRTTRTYDDKPPGVTHADIQFPVYGGSWASGDSKYDADTQAKLIALSAAFFSTDTTQLRQALEFKAHNIRAAAGKSEDDALVDDAPVLSAAAALDSALSSEPLTGKTFDSAVRPYVTISAFQSNTSTVTYTFGKTGISVSLPVLTGNDGSVSDIVSRISVTETAHYGAYIFYLSAWKADCDDAVKALKGTGIPEAEIGTVSVDNNAAFTGAWNSIGPSAGEAAVPFVIIDTHATPMALDGSGLNIQVFSIAADFEDKKIDRLILLGCNAGHLDFKETNPAAALLKKTGGGLVFASDGTVFPVGADASGYSLYESRNDKDFQSCIGTNGRPNLGWVVYRAIDGGKSGGGIDVTETGKFIVTIPWFLENPS